MALSGAQEAAMAAYMAAMAAAGGAVDPVAMSKAQMYAAMAKEASDAAAMATTSEMAMEYQMKAEMNRDSAMEAAGMPGLGVTMLANKQLNGDDIENAELDGSTPPKAASNATNVDAAIAAATAPANDGTSGFTNQGGMSGTDTQSTITAVTDTAVVAHKAGGSTFAVNIGTTRLQTGETPSRFQTKGGWEAQDLLFQADAATVKTHLVVSTDIQATPPRESVYSGTGAAIPATAVITGDVPGDGSNFEVLLNLDPDDNDVPITAQIFCADPATTPCSISVAEDGTIVNNANYLYRTTKTTADAMPDGELLSEVVYEAN